MSRIGREKHIKKQEKCSPILAHAQQLVYTLVSLMPSEYQRDNLQAMLGLFLQAQGCPLPEYSQTKSASALKACLKR